jgi:uncharacterized protein (DUF1800 family)
MSSLFSRAIACVARVALLLPVVLSAQAFAQASPDATIVEFYLAPQNKYFLTSKPSEWAVLDGLSANGWRRTGLTYAAYSGEADPAAKPVCRFFHPGVVTHFYSIDPVECALLRSLPRDFVDEGVAWYAYSPAVNASEPSGKSCASSNTALFRTFNNGAIASNGPANHRYFGDYTFYQTYSAKGYALEGLAMCLPQTSVEKRADAARLLFQATFGARPDDIATVTSTGTTAWIDQQLNLAPSQYTPRDWVSNTRPDTCVNNSTPPLTPTSYCQRDNYTLYLPQKEFFQQAINNPDQLRQRVAWALSQFFVTSGVDVGQAYGMIDYQQMLRDEAFGNFKTLLTKVTLHGAMGRFLDMANNQKPDAARGIEPNENYARELMQLFSLGLYQLNNDGSYKRDAKGVALDAYTQEDVEDLAHVMTGWTYPTVPGQPSRTVNPNNNKGYMEERAQYHEFAEKTVLGKRIASNLSQSQRLNAALDAIFVHPNVAPFVSKFLIQHLVTGDPSPSYIDRVAKVFQNNGSGVRGDMKAVVRAVLTDIEARGAAKWAPSYGHLSEPVLKLTRLARAMNTTTDGVYFRGATASAAQNVFYAPSVFNYYPPDYSLSKSEVLAPEFAIYNTSTALARVNTIYATVYSNIQPDATVLGATGTQFNLTPYTSIAADSNALLDRMNEVLFAGRMTAATRATIKKAVDAVAATDAVERVRMALFLSASAPDSQVLR